jgi:acyl-CoA reductase-like NAD-dependent aldehyde dehydrogenase
MTDTLQLSHWINGERTGGDRPGESLNPSDTREVVARMPDGSMSDVDDAVAAAKAAFPAWPRPRSGPTSWTAQVAC